MRGITVVSVDGVASSRAAGAGGGCTGVLASASRRANLCVMASGAADSGTARMSRAWRGVPSAAAASPPVIVAAVDPALRGGDSGATTAAVAVAAAAATAAPAALPTDWMTTTGASGVAGAAAAAAAGVATSGECGKRRDTAEAGDAAAVA